MSKQEIKLQKIKKSVNISSKIVSVIFVIMIVISALLLVCSIATFAAAEPFNEAIISSGMSESMDAFITKEQMNITSDIPALQIYFDSHQYGYAYSIGFYLVMITAYCLSACVLLGFTKNIFSIIKDAESPFDVRVLKPLRITFIVLAVIIACSVSNVFSIVVALILWCVYNFFSYGCELQKLSDETL